MIKPYFSLKNNSEKFPWQEQKWISFSDLLCWMSLALGKELLCLSGIMSDLLVIFCVPSWRKALLTDLPPAKAQGSPQHNKTWYLFSPGTSLRSESTDRGWWGVVLVCCDWCQQWNKTTGNHNQTHQTFCRVRVPALPGTENIELWLWADRMWHFLSPPCLGWNFCQDSEDSEPRI